jgi:hypothetical protein
VSVGAGGFPKVNVCADDVPALVETVTFLEPGVAFDANAIVAVAVVSFVTETLLTDTLSPDTDTPKFEL